MTGRILVIDDVDRNVKFLEAKLESEYYNVFTANSARKGIEIAKTVNPDVILLDVMMPEMDGIEACTILKKDLETMHIPVVMVTALNEQEDRVKGLKAGANDFITKPIDEVHLLARVKSLVRLKLMFDELMIRDKTFSTLGIETSNKSFEVQESDCRVLVIDDDLIEKNRIKKILESLYYKVTFYNLNADESQLKDKEFDIILISSVLDQVDSIRLILKIRNIVTFRKTPVIHLIPSGNSYLIAKSLELGMDDYLLTPIEQSELLARVKNNIRYKVYHDLLKQNYQKSLSESIIDSLTKLYNRRFFDEHIDKMIEDSKAKQSPLCLLALDIDHFKQINDKPGWGHPIGDEVLRAVSLEIKNSLRSIDLLARYGGEEFIVVMPSTSIEDAKIVAERIRKNVEKKVIEISASPGFAKCTISIGLAIMNKDYFSAEELKKRADFSLYKAKELGRNMVVAFE
jgi:two-component system cell cycle response regulator